LARLQDASDGGRLPAPLVAQPFRTGPRRPCPHPPLPAGRDPPPRPITSQAFTPITRATRMAAPATRDHAGPYCPAPRAAVGLGIVGVEGMPEPVLAVAVVHNGRCTVTVNREQRIPLREDRVAPKRTLSFRLRIDVDLFDFQLGRSSSSTSPPISSRPSLSCWSPRRWGAPVTRLGCWLARQT
jgi:hypothetical protein